MNRKNEIAKKRLDHRLSTLESFFKVWLLIEKVRIGFQLYGRKDEINLFEKFIRSCEANNLPEANQTLAELVPLVRNRIRNELGV